MSLNCQHAGHCGGCPWIERPYAAQLEEKQQSYRMLWQEAGLDLSVLGDFPIHSAAEGALRDRVDLTLFREEHGMCLGLYDLDRKHIVDMKACPMMTPPMAAWFARFRGFITDLRLGSLRLRVAPDGRRGIWLDFPNVEITRFLDEGVWLRLLMREAHVEMSQRRNTLRSEDDHLILADPQQLPWFQTYLGDEEQPVPLYCSVGGFTQAGFEINRQLVRRVRALARQSGASTWLELGSGIGNFTLPLAAEGWQVTALENDPRANLGNQRSLQEADLSESVKILPVNIHRADPGFVRLLCEADAVLADPPRSGLRAFLDVLDSLEPDRRPNTFLYVSCFATSMIADVARLMSMGYRPISAEGLDQFPQSKHCEWIMLLQRNA